MAALLEAYLGRRSANRVQAGASRRGTGETIRAALLSADLRDFTALSEAKEPADVITALDAWFDRVAGPVHAFGGEILKFIGDGVLAIFPVHDTPAEACGSALSAVLASQAGMAHLDAERRAKGSEPLPFGAALHLGEIFWGISARQTDSISRPSALLSTLSADWKDCAGRSAGRFSCQEHSPLNAPCPWRHSASTCFAASRRPARCSRCPTVQIVEPSRRPASSRRLILQGINRNHALKLQGANRFRRLMALASHCEAG